MLQVDEIDDVESHTSKRSDQLRSQFDQSVYLRRISLMSSHYDVETSALRPQS